MSLRGTNCKNPLTAIQNYATLPMKAGDGYGFIENATTSYERQDDFRLAA
jgi:hypothetical protein